MVLFLLKTARIMYSFLGVANASHWRKHVPGFATKAKGTFLCNGNSWALHHGNWIFVKTEGQVGIISDFWNNSRFRFLSVIDFSLKNAFTNIFLSPLSDICNLYTTLLTKCDFLFYILIIHLFIYEKHLDNIVFSTIHYCTSLDK